ncbi:MAG: hypothetical protein ACHQE5_06360, partial [Actinomycetes bacterium]
MRGILQPVGFVVALEIEPEVRNVIAGEEGLDLVTSFRPAVPDDTERPRVVGMGIAPVAQQVV